MGNNRDIINPERLYNVEGFTHAVRPKGSETIYLSGQLAWDQDFQLVGEGDIAKQTTKVYDNIQKVLDELGATWDNVAKTTIYTTRPEEHETIAGVKQTFLKDTQPPA